MQIIMAKEHCGREEIEKDRTPCELWTWLTQKIDQICSTQEGLKDFRLQKGHIKQLVEEIVPLAIFGMHKYFNTDQIFLQSVVGSQNFDAKVIDRRTEPASVTFVEITQAHEGIDNYFRRCELLEKGFVFSYAPVIKTGKGRNRIVSIPPKAIPVEERAENELDRILDAAKKKASKDYPRNTVLLIFFDDSQPFQEVVNHEKLDIFTNEKILKLDLRFSGLYLIGETKDTFREYPIDRQD
jgi:hypothetical protein